MKASVSGFVEADGVGAPGYVEAAEVKWGNKLTYTDKFGYFEINDADVIADAAQLIIAKGKHSTSYKTFKVSDGGSVFTRVKLKNFGSYLSNGGSGATINIYATGSPIITLPGDPFVETATGLLYSGEVFYFAYGLSPQDEFGKQLIGDRRGIDSSGKLKMLHFANGVLLEFTGKNGQKLQLAPGKTISVSMMALKPLRNPGSIAVWYYDTSTGFWKQQGRASQNASGYSANVTQASSLVFADPSEYVEVTGRLVSVGSKPVAFQEVHLAKEAADPGTPIYSYSDLNGNFLAIAEVNTQQFLEVTGNVCRQSILKTTVAVQQNNIKLSNIQLPPNQTFSVSGTVKACNGANVPDGHVFVSYGGNEKIKYNTTGDGNFEFTLTNCDPGIFHTLIITPIERSTNQTGDVKFIQMVQGHNNLGNLGVCGKSYDVILRSKLKDQTGTALSNVIIKIKEVGVNTTYDYLETTVMDGSFAAYVKTNTAYHLEIYSTVKCVSPVYTYPVSTIINDTTLADIIVPGVAFATVTGSLIDCNVNPVSNGSVVMIKNERRTVFPVNSNGTFSFKIPVCGGVAESITLFPVDATKLLTGDSVNTMISVGSNGLPAIPVCLTSSPNAEYLNYIIDDTVVRTILFPRDQLRQYVDAQEGWITVAGLQQGRPPHEGVYVNFMKQNIAVGQKQWSPYFVLPELYQYTSVDSSLVDILEYGPVGSFVTGEMKGRVVDDNGIFHNVMCRFRVKRTE
ncbi:hypothetical protein [Lacibacter sediminis]|uniref:Carboxypeptidase regulatory-like domain-containing protein n=1 Tax=Lacibacter sediminis TaxID=2760713 RepID=A0A7G5XCF0_9BACT|nr:hypothetical protein [Lacibacter sediminis]QNA43153.1 hypothetical protein H4075_13795 [Lacibacter sediminis]